MTKRNPTASAVEFNNIVAQLDHLTTRRRTLEDGLQRAATRELYEILAGCSSLYSRLALSTTLKSKLSQALKQRNVTQTAGTSLQLKVIRYVFGECSQEHVYAKAIKVAQEEKPENVHFVDWLTDQGGPAGIKTKSKPKPVDTSHLIAVASQHYKEAPSLSLQFSDALQANVDAEHTYSVALIRVDTSDPTKREIVFGTANRAVVNRVLEFAGSSLPPDKLDLRDASDSNLDLQPLSLEAAE